MSEGTLHQAFLLHTRTFKESSVIAECFTKDLGLIACMIKGAKRPKSKYRGIVQPFVLLDMSWRGKGEVKNIIQMDARCVLPTLTGKNLLMGFYLNELLFKLLHRSDPFPELFEQYHNALIALNQSNEDSMSQTILRHFECALIKALGFGLDFQTDTYGEKIQADLIYGFDPDQGFYIQDILPQSKKLLSISGATLLALLDEKQLLNAQQLVESKKLMRWVISHQLGGKDLNTRQLFAKQLAAANAVE